MAGLLAALASGFVFAIGLVLGGMLLHDRWFARR